MTNNRRSSITPVVYRIAPNLFFDVGSRSLCKYADECRTDRKVSPTGFEILKFLSEAGSVCSYSEIFSAVWGSNPLGLQTNPENHIKRYISELRSAISELVSEPDAKQVIRTHTGYGYSVDVEGPFSSIDEARWVSSLESEGESEYGSRSARTRYYYLDTAERPFYIISNFPSPRSIFEGRTDKLDEIKKAFQEGNRIIYLWGMGGIGKSEIAKQYAARNHMLYYDNIVFFSYEGNFRKSITNKVDIGGLARRLHEDDEEFYQRKLKAVKLLGTTRTLFILDNFDAEHDQWLTAFLEQGSYKVIITSRYSHRDSDAKEIEITPINDPNALINIFQQYYGSSIPVSEIDAVKSIISLVASHTYTIELVAKLMRTHRLKAQEIYETLQQGLLMESITGEFRSGNERGTFEHHITSLFKFSVINENEIAKKIMFCLSLIGIDGIDETTFKEWMGISYEMIDLLISGSWVRRIKQSDIHYLSLHPIVRDVVRSEYYYTEGDIIFFLKAAGEFCYDAWYRTLKENMEVASSIQEIVRYLNAGKPQNYLIFESMISFLWQIGQFEEGIKYGHILYEKCEKEFGRSDMRTGFMAKSLGGCYFNSGRLNESVPWYELCLQIMLDSGAPESEDIALAYEKVARCCTWECHRDFKRAEECMGRALEIRKRLRDRVANGEHLTWLADDLSEYTLDMAVERIGENYMEMGRMYQCMGNYEVALDCTQKYEKILDQIKDKRECINARSYIAYDLAVSHYHIALKMRNNDNEDDAEKHLKEARGLLESALNSNLEQRGEMAVDTIKNRIYLGDVYAAQGLYDEAVGVYKVALNTARERLGESNSNVKDICERIERYTSTK